MIYKPFLISSSVPLAIRDAVFAHIKATWLAEMYAADQTRPRKSWKALLSEQTGEIRTFANPDEAELALIEARGPFTDTRSFYVQLSLGISEEQRWHELISQAEQQDPGSLEEMIKDASTRLVAAMRELRQCKNQREANKLYEIVIGQSNRLHYLTQFVNDESRRLQWLKVDQREKS